MNRDHQETPGAALRDRAWWPWGRERVASVAATRRAVGIGLLVSLGLGGVGWADAPVDRGETEVLVPEGEPREALEGAMTLARMGDVVAVALAPDGRSLASGSLDGTVRLWDAASG